MPTSEYVRRLREKIGHDLLLLPSVTVVILDGRGRVLLARHAETGGWVVPGGSVEPHETPADAVVREAWEETGLRVEPTRVLGVYGGPEFVVTYRNGDAASYLMIPFACRVMGGEPRPDGKETLELAYFSQDELDGLALPSWARIMLRDVFRHPERTSFAPPIWEPPTDGHRASGISDYMRRLREKVGTDLLLSVGAAALIFDEQGRVLLQKRGDNGRWGLIGGAVDPHERPADAVVREVWEETGLRVEPTRVVGVYGGPDFHVLYPNGDQVSVVSVAFQCRVVGGAMTPDGNETLDLAYFAPQEALSRLALPERFRKRINHALDRGDGARFDPPTWQPSR